MAKVLLISETVELPEVDDEFLGDEEQETPKRRAEAIELKELLSSIIGEVGQSIECESLLKLELTGSVKIGAGVEAGLPSFVCLNLFKAKASGEKFDSVRITLETKVQPKPRSNKIASP